MSEADSLRMVAEVVDRFSGPLRNLRAALQSMSKDDASHAEVVQKGFNRVEAAAKSAGQTASTVLNPALAMVGITGLGVVAAMTGIGAAIRAFGGNVAGLAQLGRDTGVAAEQLRDVQSVLGKVGVDADTSAGAIRRFAENMRLARDGIGPIMEFLRTQGRTAEGRAYFNQLADAMKNAKDNGEALTLALEGLEHIQDPAGRRKYAEEILGLADAARLADGHLGTLAEQFAKVRREAGPLDPATVKAAEDFDKAMNGLGATMRKLGTAIATEAMPYVSELVTGIKDLADGGRADSTVALRQAVRDIGDALKGLDWKGAKEGALSFFHDVRESAHSVAEAIGAVGKALGILDDLRHGRVGDALGKLNEVDRKTDLGLGKGGLPGTIQGSAQADVGPLIERQSQIQKQLQVLDEAISRKESAPDPLGGDAKTVATTERERRQQLTDEMARLSDQIRTTREVATAKKPDDAAGGAAGSKDPADAKRADDQRRELSRNTDELRRLREALPDRKPGEAAAQKTALDAGDAPFGDAKIQTASFTTAATSMARVGNALADAHRRGMGINVPEGPLRSGRLTSPSLEAPERPLRTGRLTSPSLAAPEGPRRSGQIEIPGLRDLPSRMPRQPSGGMPPMTGDALTRLMPQLRPFLRGMPGLGSRGPGRGASPSPGGILPRLLPQIRPLLRGMPETGVIPGLRPRRFAGLPDGGERLPDEGAPRRRPIVGKPAPRAPQIEPRQGGPGERVRRWQKGPEQGSERVGRSATSAEGRENVASWLGFFQRPKDGGGMGLPPDKARAMVAMMQGESGRNLNPRTFVPNDNGGPSGGTAQWHDRFGRRERLSGLKEFAERQGKPWTDRDLQQQFWKHEAETTHRKAFAAIERSETAEDALREGINRFESPKDKAGEFRKRLPNLNRLRRDRVAEGAPETPSAQPEVADGGGFAARQRAVQAFRQEGGLNDAASQYRALQGRMDALATPMNSSVEDPGMRALRAGALGSTPKLDANGSVHIRVDKAGPDTQVSTSTRGDLFRDVTVQRGRTMAQASQSD